MNDDKATAALFAEIDRLRSDRDCEKRLRKDAEEARENLIVECDRLRAQVAAMREDVDQWQLVVYTLIGHAEGLYAEGQHDMPTWFYELAEKIARVHLDEASAIRVRECAAIDRAREPGRAATPQEGA